MGFEDIFENKRTHDEEYRRQNYHPDNKYSHDAHHSQDGYDPRKSDHGYAGQMHLSAILAKIKGNNTLKLLIVFAGIFIIAILVVLIILFMPVILKIIDYISKNGLQGITEVITAFLDKILKGAVK